MTKIKTKVTRAAALATLLGGLGACAESSVEGGPTNAPNQDPVEAAIGELGVVISGCDIGGVGSTGNGLATNTLTLAVGADPLVLSAAGGVFTANGYKCTQYVTGTSGPTKTVKIADVKQIKIKGDASNNKVILDFLPGTFGTGVLASSMGGITIDFAAATGANDTDSVMLRGGSLAEKYRFAASTALGAVTDIYVEINNDHTADIDIKPSQNASAAKVALTASMGGGNDEVIANATSTDITSFGSTATLTGVAGLPAGYGVTAYGGPGDDKFTGGLGDDAFYGGADADNFKMNVASDGADIYSGDNGIDTVEYGARMAPLKIDLGPKNPAVVGGVDLSTPGLYGASGSLVGKLLAVSIDGVRVETTFTTAPAKPSDIIDALNTAIRLKFTGSSAVDFAAITGKNQLRIMSNTNNGTSSFVKIDEDSGIIAGGADAAATLGLTTLGVVTTPPAVGVAVDLTTAGLGATLDTKQLVMLLNGVYVRVVFANPADETAILAQINAACNAALGTTSVKYATATALHLLSIAATTLDIKDGTMAYPLSATSAAAALGFNSKIEGTVDVVATTALYGAGGTLENRSLSLVIDGARVDWNAGTAPVAVTTATTGMLAVVNAAFNTELGTISKTYVSLSATNHLVVNSNTDVGNTSAVRFETDPAVAAGTVDAAVALGIVAAKGAKIVGTVDLSTLTLPLATTQLTLVVNGKYVVVDTSSAADVTALLLAINTGIQTALGGSATYATQNATTKKLELAGATWFSVKDGHAAYAFGSAGNAASSFGFGYNVGVTRSVSDADDGLDGEHDDVRWSTENINGGISDDIIYGNELKNIIKGGTGNDVISGGANGATCTSADGDTLQGDDGDDTFVLSAPNCRAALTGGDGNNVADFSGRSAALQLRNNGTADDGEGTNGAESVNIGTDIKKMIGGFGADNITGGAGDDFIIGGPGADTMTGGTGFDTVDYSAAPITVRVSLCFASAVTSCGGADDGTWDGTTSEGDSVYQVEHLIGSKNNDTMTVYMTTTNELLFEGGAGDDVITGSLANDTIYGDVGNDMLTGGAGDDTISGDAGDDFVDGGDGDDICLVDTADVTRARANCEP